MKTPLGLQRSQNQPTLLGLRKPSADTQDAQQNGQARDEQPEQKRKQCKAKRCERHPQSPRQTE
jgi:hypothetical protein